MIKCSLEKYLIKKFQSSPRASIIVEELSNSECFHKKSTKERFWKRVGKSLSHHKRR